MTGRWWWQCFENGMFRLKSLLVDQLTGRFDQSSAAGIEGTGDRTEPEISRRPDLKL